MSSDNIITMDETCKKEIGFKVASMYDLKSNNKSVIKRSFKFKQPRNINYDDFQAIVAICSSERTKFILKPEPSYELQGGGWFNIWKVPAGAKIDVKLHNSRKKNSKKIGINLDKFGINFEDDGQTSNSLENKIRITHDIIVVEIKGDKKFFGKQYLDPHVEYIEIDRILENTIYEKILNEDIKKHQPIEEEIEEYNKESLFRRIYKNVFGNN